MTDSAGGEPTDAGAAGRDAIVIRLGAGRFAVGMLHVAEVGRVPPVTRVPGLPSWVSGVANWRGRILPVLDLHQLLGAGAGDVRTASRVLVLAEGGVTVGLLVDEVLTTATLDPDVEPYPATLPAADLLSGQVVHDGGPVAVIDVDAVMRLRDALPRGRRTA